MLRFQKRSCWPAAAGSDIATTKRTRIGVLALQGDFAEHRSVLEQLDIDVTEVRLPGDLVGLDGLIIPGGESTTIARLMAEWGLLEPIREKARRGLAIWGTCAGAILIAKEPGDLDREALGLMDIAVQRNAFGRQVDSFEAELSIAEIGKAPFRAVFIRAPRITSAGPNVRVLGQLQDGSIVAAQEGTLLATSFHPELTGDRRFHELFANIAKDSEQVTEADLVEVDS